MDPQIEDVRKSTWHYVWHQHGVLFGSIVAFGIAATVVIAIALYEAFVLQTGNFEPVSFIWIFAPLLIVTLIYNYFATKVQSLFMQQMAASLGYMYAPTALFESVDGLYFQLGHSARLYDVMSGTYRDRAVRFFTYQYTVGGGKSSQTYIRSIFELQYNAPLPHVAMNFPTLIGSYGLEPVELEGDFNKSVSLLVEKGKQIEIREIFQPDTMQDFLGASLSGYTMEIYHDLIYLICAGPISNRQEFERTIGIIDRLCDDILPNLRAVVQP